MRRHYLKGMLFLCPTKPTHYFTAFLFLCFSGHYASAQPNYSGLFLANQNTTGAVQTPLSLGNWSSPTTVPSFTFNTSDNGTSYLDVHSTRWGESVSFSRSDPTGNSYNLMTVFGNNTAGGELALYNTSNTEELLLNSQGPSYFAGGNVLIGKTSQTNSGYMLDVNGSGRLNQVVVNGTGADYVFDPGYRLLPLDDLESYVHKEHHLPGIASAGQMQQEGVNLGDNQTRLLAKIEELTLYLIQEDKRSAALQEKIEQLEERNKLLEARDRELEGLEKRIQLLEQQGR
jgi:hypothetical protein